MRMAGGGLLDWLPTFFNFLAAKASIDRTPHPRRESP